MEFNELEFSQIIAQALLKEDFLVKTEVPSGYGVADVVALKINKNQVVKRLGYRQVLALAHESYFQVLSLLGEIPENAASVDEIVKHLPFSKSYVKNVLLKDLIKKSYVKMVGSDTYFKINGWAPLSDDIIAIESKLHDWNRGLTQALRYKTFANRVYLALPEEKVHLVNKQLLKEMNIGLLTISDGKLLRLYTPIKQTQKIIKSKQDYVCEHFWREMISMESTF